MGSAPSAVTASGFSTVLQSSFSSCQKASLRAVEFDAGGEGLFGRGDDGGIGGGVRRCPSGKVGGGAAELFAGFLADGANGDFDEIGQRGCGRCGEVGEAVVCEGVGAGGEAGDIPGEEVHPGVQRGDIGGKQGRGREPVECRVAAQEVAVDVHRADRRVRCARTFSKSQKVADLADIAFVGCGILGF